MPTTVTDHDPWTPRPMRHEPTRAGDDVLAAYTTALNTFLIEARVAVLEPVIAAGAGYRMVGAFTRLFRWPHRQRWVELLRNHVLPALKQAYQQARNTSHNSSDSPPDPGEVDVPVDVWVTIELEYDQAFHQDSWSDHLYGQVRDELADSRTHDDPPQLVRDRLARLLSPHAPVTRIRDALIRRARHTPDTPPEPPELGDTDYTHHNAAVARARWSSVGIANRATLDAAQQQARVTGDQLYTVWISTHDHRVRDTHRAADKQSVPLGGLFRVGAALLRFPGDPLGPPAETANCRCALSPIDRDGHDRFTREREMDLPNHTETETGPAVAGGASTHEEPLVRWRGMLAPLNTRADYRVLGLPEGGEVRTNNLMLLSHQEEARPGHDGKRTIGRVDRAWVENGELWAEGVFNPDKPLAREIARDIANGFHGNVSVDLADSVGEERFYDSDGHELSTEGHDEASFAAAHPQARKLMFFPSWRLSGATTVQDPAFHTGWITVLNEDSDQRKQHVERSESSVANEVDGSTGGPGSPEPAKDTDTGERVTAAAVGGSSWAQRVAAVATDQDEPDPAVFADPHLAGPTKVTVRDDATVFGHVACWGTEHISFPGKGVRPPRSETGYGMFHRHPVRCSDGSRVRTGALVMGTGHADLHMSTSAASSHYDHTGHVVADVIAGEDEHGIWVAGALSPGVTPLQVTVLDKYSLSGDWRGGELVSALVVNTPGFPIPAALAASGELPLTTPSIQVRTDDHGEQYALVAAGIVAPTPEQAAAAITSGGTELVMEVRALRDELAVERQHREQVEADRQEQDTRARVFDLVHRIQQPRLERIEAFATKTGKPKPAPTSSSKKQAGKSPPGQDTQSGDTPPEQAVPAPPKDSNGTAASEAAKKTSPNGDEAPDPSELGEEYKKEKDAQAEANTPGLLEDEGAEGEEAEPNPGLLDDEDTGPTDEDFELMSALLDELDDEDIALIEVLTGLPVHQKLEEAQAQAEDPGGATPPDLTSEVARKQKESDDADPLKQARNELDEEENPEGGSSASTTSKKKPTQSKKPVTADAGALIAAKAPNWVSKHGGLPQYVRRIAKHLKKKGFTESHAIATAINVVKKMCRNSGDRLNFPGAQQKVKSGSIAQACADVAQWSAMKAATKGT